MQYSDGTIAKIADHLIENGVIVPPCQIGDEIIKLHRVNLVPTGEAHKAKIVGLNVGFYTQTDDGTQGYFDLLDVNNTVFLTKEAERKLAERNDTE